MDPYVPRTYTKHYSRCWEYSDSYIFKWCWADNKQISKYIHMASGNTFYEEKKIDEKIKLWELE